MPRKPKRKPPAPKRVHIEAYITEGLRLAVGAEVRSDGKPATEEQCREWLQKEMDDISAKMVDHFEGK